MTTTVTRAYTFESILHLLEPKPKVSTTPKADTKQPNGMDDGSGNEDGGDEVAAEDSEEAAADAAPALPDIALAWYGPEEGTLCVMPEGGADSGYFYTCTWEMPQPLRAEALLGNPKVPASQRTVARAGGYHIIALANGAVHVMATGNSKQAFVLSLHSVFQGRARMALGYQDRFLVTAGDDGNIFVLTTHWPDLGDGSQPIAEELSLAPLVLTARGEDIADTAAYSFEEALQKAEQDRYLLTADEKKRRRRVAVETLRKEFEALVRRTASLAPSQQLPRSAFELDPQIRLDMATAKEEVRARARVCVCMCVLGKDGGKSGYALHGAQRWFSWWRFRR
jgi:hypothetical protein